MCQPEEIAAAASSSEMMQAVKRNLVIQNTVNGLEGSDISLDLQRELLVQVADGEVARMAVLSQYIAAGKSPENAAAEIAAKAAAHILSLASSAFGITEKNQKANTDAAIDCAKIWLNDTKYKKFSSADIRLAFTWYARDSSAKEAYQTISISLFCAVLDWYRVRKNRVHNAAKEIIETQKAAAHKAQLEVIAKARQAENEAAFLRAAIERGDSTVTDKMSATFLANLLGLARAQNLLFPDDAARSELDLLAWVQVIDELCNSWYFGRSVIRGAQTESEPKRRARIKRAAIWVYTAVFCPVVDRVQFVLSNLSDIGRQHFQGWFFDPETKQYSDVLGYRQNLHGEGANKVPYRMADIMSEKEQTEAQLIAKSYFNEKQTRLLYAQIIHLNSPALLSGTATTTKQPSARIREYLDGLK